MNTLYYEWFENPLYWFQHNKITDNYLCNKYLKQIEKTDKILEYKEIYSKETLISSVLLLDQIPRHYKRLGYDIDVDYYSEKACKFSNFILQIYRSLLTIDELCFICLPYRHLKDIDKIHEIIDKFIILYDKSNSKNKTKCRRFLNATLNNIYKTISNNYVVNNLPVKSWFELNEDIFQVANKTNNYIDNVSNIIKSEFLKLPKDANIIVSLSGGVDSIVALDIISKLTKNVMAIHINYNNRTESTDELDFVNYYCNKLKVKLIYRTITEIKRKSCLNNGLRDIYENVTKKIRMDMYSRFIDANTYILLGHNKDDSFENIITNIINKNNYSNLSGMEILKNIDNINFWRPMLNINKKEIIEYANYNNIPYLFDSTPKWSIRGKIRDKLKPLICNLKNSENNDIEAFFDLKNYIKETNDIINNVVINNIYDKFQKENDIITGIFSISDLYTFRYKSVVKALFNKMNISVSNKTLGDFIEYINRFILTNKEKYFILNKNNNITIKNTDNNLYKKFIIM